MSQTGFVHIQWKEKYFPPSIKKNAAGQTGICCKQEQAHSAAHL
jgi:hypothetical protein